MKAILYEKFDNDEITASMIRDAAKLFSENYGIWSDHNSVKVGKAGQHVRFTTQRLQSTLLPEGADCSLARVTVDGTLAGHALACYWKADNMKVGWVTQLVVHEQYRERGLATGLLNVLRRDDVNAWGILSSHPAACMAAAKAFSSSIDKVALHYIHCFARAMMKSSPIQYVREARLHGSLFGSSNIHESVSTADTEFFVDHGEPNIALDRMRSQNRWPLGGLPDGHESLLIVEAKRRFSEIKRSRA